MSEAGKTPNPPETANDEGLAPEDEMMSESLEQEYGAPDPKAVAIALAERVNELEDEITTLKDERLRALAEADNARRRAQKDRVRAAVPVAMPGAQRLGRRRYIGFSRLTLARGQFTTEPAAPLAQLLLESFRWLFSSPSTTLS